MSDPTVAMHDTDFPTEAYVRPAKPTWRQRAEDRITWTRGIYDTIEDAIDRLIGWAPAIAATITLIWLTATFHR
jgi:hypothetical protein